MKLVISTIVLLVSAFLTISAAPIEQNVPALEIASPKILTSVTSNGDVGIRADTDVNETSKYGAVTADSSEVTEDAGEASQYEERNLLPHSCQCQRAVSLDSRGFHHMGHPCASAPPAPGPTTTVVVTQPAPTPAPKPVPVPVPVPVPAPAPEPVPVPVPVPVPA